MAIPLSKAKQVCTTSEFALVRASRKPDLNKLSPEQSKNLAGRARKAFDKWQDMERGQARAGSAGERTRLKTDLFREALDRFEEKAATSSGTAKRAGAQSKKVRAVGHRKARAAVRKELAGASKVWGARARATGGKGAVRKPAAKKAKSGRAATASAAQKHRPPLKWSNLLSGGKFTASPDKQRAVRTRAKKARLAESGLTSRVRGQISASGKRNQARRDRKGSQAR